MKNKIVTIILAFILLGLISFMIFSNSKKVNPLKGEELRAEASSTTVEENKLDEIASTLPEEEVVEEEKNPVTIDKLEDEYIAKNRATIIAKNNTTRYEVDENSNIILKEGNFSNFQYEIKDATFDVESYSMILTLDMYALDFESTMEFMNTNFSLLYANTPLEMISKERKYEISQEPTEVVLKFKCNEEIGIRDFNNTFFKLRYQDELNLKENDVF